MIYVPPTGALIFVLFLLFMFLFTKYFILALKHFTRFGNFITDKFTAPLFSAIFKFLGRKFLNFCKYLKFNVFK